MKLLLTRMSVKSIRAGRTLPKFKLEEVLTDKDANRAFLQLIQEGASSEQLEIYLGRAASGFFLPRSYDMLAVEGMTREQLRSFPNTIRAVSVSILKVEENPNLSTWDSDTPREAVTRIVDDLRHYAEELESTIQFARRFMKEHSNYWNFRSTGELKLLDYVEKCTGKRHFAAVAALLTAAVMSMGMDIVVTEQSLKKLNKRNCPKKPFGWAHTK
jgi:hypothetical protein